ncbi:MAG: CGNR zinc finger domain-containing protein [Candidatus Binatus sp.]
MTNQWLSSVWRDAVRRCGQRPDERADALLRLLQRKGLDSLKGAALDAALADLALICVVGGRYHLPEGLAVQPEVTGPQVAEFADMTMWRLRDLLKNRRVHVPVSQITLEIGWKESQERLGTIVFWARDFLGTCSLGAWQLLADHLGRIQTCQRPKCGNLFVVRRRKVYCSPQCAARVHVKRFLDSLGPEERGFIRRATYLRQLLKRDRVHAEHYLARLMRKDQKTASRLAKEVIEGKARRRSTVVKKRGHRDVKIQG